MLGAATIAATTAAVATLALAPAPAALANALEELFIRTVLLLTLHEYYCTYRVLRT